MTEIVLPVSQTNNAPCPGIERLSILGFNASSQADTRPVRIHIHNSLTNVRGNDFTLVKYFANAAERAVAAGTLNPDHTFQFSFSNAGVPREVSRLDDASFEKDRRYIEEFHTVRSLDEIDPDLIFVTGWEPENSAAPTSIENDHRSIAAGEIIAWAEASEVPTVLSCRAAHLGLSNLFENEAEPVLELLPRKLKSITAVDLRDPSAPIVSGLPSQFSMPISRLCGFNQTAMQALIDQGSVDEVAHSPEAGTIIATRDNFIYISGHMECDRASIAGEDARDHERDTLAGKPPELHLGPTRNFDPADQQPRWEQDGLVIGGNILALAAEHAEARRQDVPATQAYVAPGLAL